MRHFLLIQLQDIVEIDFECVGMHFISSDVAQVKERTNGNFKERIYALENSERDQSTYLLNRGDGLLKNLTVDPRNKRMVLCDIFWWKVTVIILNVQRMCHIITVFMDKFKGIDELDSSEGFLQPVRIQLTLLRPWFSIKEKKSLK